MPKALEQQFGKPQFQLAAPITPGRIVSLRFFVPLNMSQAEFCKKWGMKESTLSRIFSGQSRITPDTATIFSAAFGMSAMFFLNLQNQYDLAMTDNKRS